MWLSFASFQTLTSSTSSGPIIYGLVAACAFAGTPGLAGSVAGAGLSAGGRAGSGTAGLASMVRGAADSGLPGAAGFWAISCVAWFGCGEAAAFCPTHRAATQIKPETILSGRFIVLSKS